MNLEIKLDAMAKDIARRALDEATYKGKTLREWINLVKVYAGAKDDLISRSALLEDLGASCYDLDALTGITGDERTLQEAILQFPAIDTVPVVRCNDCEHWDRGWLPSNGNTGEHFCPMIGLVTGHDFYCKHGAKMDGEPHDP